MKKEIKEYLSEVEIRLKDEKSIDERFVSDMLTRIGFYQHERLIHLIVTMTFAVMTVLSFLILIMAQSVPALLLSCLFLVLVSPYIAHYYFLENSVQKLYRLYYKALEMTKKQ
jgi:ABC-type multidrug transport system fused ATPase/permease subunit